MYSSIVVGTDFSDTAAKAVAQAAELAKAFNATLHIVTAFKPTISSNVAASSLEVMAYGGAEFLAEAETKMSEEIDASLARLEKDITAKGVTVKTRTAAGDPADAIIDVAEETKADLIVVGNRGMSGVKRFVMGSVSNNVSHHAPCSVLIVHTT